MRIPKIKGLIKRRILVNFRTSPGVVQRVLPSPFRPKLQGDHALVGICLIRLEQIRPAGLPRIFGLSSENAAHRIAVEWNGANGELREGVYIPRRDSESWFNRLAGGRVFPGRHHPARFSVVENAGDIQLSMRSVDETVSLKIAGGEGEFFPGSSCFASLNEASAFFEAGSLGYSPSDKGARSDGLLLRTNGWRVGVLAVSEVSSSYFEDSNRFPKGTIAFDHALIMRNIPHEWHSAEDMMHPTTPT